jgi:ankyrin repeat protein
VGQRPYDTAIERDNKPAADLLAAAEDEVHIAPESAQQQYTLNLPAAEPHQQQEPSPITPTRGSDRLTPLPPGTPPSSRSGADGDGGGAVKGFSRSVSLHSAAVMPDIAVLRRAIAGPPAPNLNAKDLKGKTPLHAAVEAGCAANAVELIKAGADPNAKDKLGHTPLRAACARGNAGLARELVALGANPAAQDNSGDTPVHAAAGNGDPATVLAVIDDPSVKQIKNKDGQLPFDVAVAKGPSHAEAAELLRAGPPAASSAEETEADKRARLLSEAVKAGDLSALQALLDGPEGSAVNVKDAEGRTPLHLACLAGRGDMAEALVARGADPKIQETASGFTAAHCAAVSGDPRTVRAILGDPAIKSSWDSEGRTPHDIAAERGHVVAAALLNPNSSRGLFEAVHAGDLPSVTFLLAAGANPNSDDAGFPLHTAAAMGRPDLVEALLGKGADPSTLDAAGAIALHHAAVNGNVPTVKLLLNASGPGAKAAQASDGRTPYDFAVAGSHAEAAELLKPDGDAPVMVKAAAAEAAERSAPAPAREPESSGLSPLLAACAAGDLDTVQRLIGEGADADERDPASQMSAMSFAAGSRSPNAASILATLSAAGADASARDNSGLTPLHFAAMAGDAEACAVLINAGASPCALNAHQETPVHWGARSRSQETCAILLGHLPEFRKRHRSNNGLTPCDVAFDSSSPDEPSVLPAVLDPAHLSGEDQAAVAKAQGERLIPLIRGQRGYEAIEAVATRTADPNEHDGMGVTALMAAAGTGDAELVKSLLVAGAILSPEDEHGWTALHHAAVVGSSSVCKLLLDPRNPGARLRPDAKTLAGETALHLAAQSGDIPTIELLLAAEPAASSSPSTVTFSLRDAPPPGPGEERVFLVAHAHSGDTGAAAALSGAAKSPLSSSELARAVASIPGGASMSPPVALPDPRFPPLAVAALPAVVHVMVQGPGSAPIRSLGQATVPAGVRVGARLPVVGAGDSSSASAEGYLVVGDVDVPSAPAKSPAKLARRVLDAVPPKMRRNNRGLTPRQVALARGFDDVAQALGDPAADGAETSLLRACWARDEKAVLDLLAGGANPNAADFFGVTPLAAVCSVCFDRTLVDALIGAGADPALADHEGRLPIHCAAANGRQVPVLLLGVTRPDLVGAKDLQGLTPLHHAAAYGDVPTVLAVLAVGGSKAETSSSNMTPYDVALSKHNHDAAEQLRDAGKPYSPLVDAIRGKDIPLAYRLLASGTANGDKSEVANQANPAGVTPLMAAAQIGHDGLVDAILAKGGKMSARDEQGYNALHYAVLGSSPVAVATLAPLAREAGLAGLTPVHLAALFGDLDMIEELLAKAGGEELKELKNSVTGELPRETARAANQPEAERLLSPSPTPAESSKPEPEPEPAPAPAPAPAPEPEPAPAPAPAPAPELQSRAPPFPRSPDEKAKRPVVTIAVLPPPEEASAAADSSDATARLGRKLVEACQAGDAPAALALLRGTPAAPPDAALDNGPTALTAASASGLGAVVAELLERGANPGTPDSTPSKRSPLHHACANSHAAIVEALLAAGADPLARDAEGNNAGHCAAEGGGAPTVKALLGSVSGKKHVAEIKRGRNKLGRVPKEVAKVKGHGDAAVMLSESPVVDPCLRGDLAGAQRALALGCDRTEPSPEHDGMTPLMAAATTGLVPVLKDLLQKEPRVAPDAARDGRGRSALHHACAGGKPEAVALLLAQGADRRCKDSTDNTPVHCAALNGDPQTVETVLGTDPDVALACKTDLNKDGDRPDAVAVAANNPKAAELLETDADRGEAEKRAMASRPQLVEACAAGRVDEARRLLAVQSQDPDEIDPETGKTALCAAAESGSVGCIDALLSRGASLNKPDKRGYTPLHFAALGSHDKAAARLVQGFADRTPETRDAKRDTALHMAAREGSVPTIQAILGPDRRTWGPLKRARNASGKTPRDVALAKGHTAAAEELAEDTIVSAIERGDAAAVQQLLSDGADPEEVHPVTNAPVLHLAAGTVALNSPVIAAAALGGGSTASLSGLQATSSASRIAATHSGPLDSAASSGSIASSTGMSKKAADQVKSEQRREAAAKTAAAAIVKALLDAGADVGSLGPGGKTALHCACEVGNAEAAQLLLDHGCTRSSEDARGNTPLHLAAGAGNLACARVALGTDPEEALELKQRLNKAKRIPRDIAVAGRHKDVARLLTADDELFEAVAAGDDKTLGDLLSIGGNASARQPSSGMTLLHKAVKRDHLGMVKALLAAGAAPNAVDKTGATPLLVAAEIGNPSMADALLSHGADPKIADSLLGALPLHVACAKDHDHFVASLLRAGAGAGAGAGAESSAAAETPRSSKDPSADPIDAADKSGDAAVHHAAKNGSSKALAELLKRKVASRAPGSGGVRAFAMALQGGHLRCAALLATPEDLCTLARARDSKTLLGLIKAGATVVGVDSKGSTLLHLTASVPALEAVTLALVQRGAEVNARDPKQNTPVHLACETGGLKNVEHLLVRGGASTVAVNAEGQTCAFVTCGKVQDPPTLRLVLTRRGNPDVQDKNKETCLHVAARNGARECVVLLLEVSASKTVRNLSGQIPYDIAVENGHHDVAELLKSFDPLSGKSIHSAVRARDEPTVAALLGRAALGGAAPPAGGAPSSPSPSSSNSNLGGAKNKKEELMMMGVLAQRRKAEQERIERMERQQLHQQHQQLGVRMASELANQRETETGLTPLHMAAQVASATDRDSAAITLVLLRYGARVDAEDPDGDTPLHIAARRDLAEVCTRLLAAGAHPASTNHAGDTPIMVAARSGSGAALEVLLGHKLGRGEVNTLHARTREVPLHGAADRGSTRCVQLLLTARADRTVKDGDGNTPYDRAVIKEHAECARLLVDIVDLVKNWAVEHLETALTNGGDPNTVDHDGRPVLHVAAELGRTEHGEALLRHGALIDGLDRVHSCALHVACQHMQVVFAMMLLRKGARANIVDQHGRTALHLVCITNDATVCEELLRVGADPRARDSAREEPLHIAGQHNACACIVLIKGSGVGELLLSRRADGLIPHQVALEADHPEAAELLSPHSLTKMGKKMLVQTLPPLPRSATGHTGGHVHTADCSCNGNHHFLHEFKHYVGPTAHGYGNLRLDKLLEPEPPVFPAKSSRPSPKKASQTSKF